jgi:hypothetical protein
MALVTQTTNKCNYYRIETMEVVNTTPAKTLIRVSCWINADQRNAAKSWASSKGTQGSNEHPVTNKIFFITNPTPTVAISDGYAYLKSLAFFQLAVDL